MPVAQVPGSSAVFPVMLDASRTARSQSPMLQSGMRTVSTAALSSRCRTPGDVSPEPLERGKVWHTNHYAAAPGTCSSVSPSPRPSGELSGVGSMELPLGVARTSSMRAASVATSRSSAQAPTTATVMRPRPSEVTQAVSTVVTVPTITSVAAPWVAPPIVSAVRRTASPMVGAQSLSPPPMATLPMSPVKMVQQRGWPSFQAHSNGGSGASTSRRADSPPPRSAEPAARPVQRTQSPAGRQALQRRPQPRQQSPPRLLTQLQQQQQPQIPQLPQSPQVTVEVDGKQRVETIEVAGKLGALEATVVEARTQLAHLGMALMAEQPEAVRGCAQDGSPGPGDSLRQSSSLPSLSARDPLADSRSEVGAAQSRTTVDTYALEGSLRKELSANLQSVRERIQAVSHECMQELIRAQMMLGAGGTPT